MDLNVALHNNGGIHTTVSIHITNFIADISAMVSAADIAQPELQSNFIKRAKHRITDRLNKALLNDK